MGQRANLILVEEGRYELFYSHWCANTLTRDLFWGPQHATAFIRMQRQVEESEWLDDVWAEGGAIVDWDANVLLFFGGEDLLYDVPLRRVYFKLLGQVWRGWDVRWAHEGIADLADYVGYPRSKVLSRECEAPDECSLEPPNEREWVDTIGSVLLDEGSIHLFPLAGDALEFLAWGPRLLDAVRKQPSLERLLLDDWTDTFPGGGFHLDSQRREVAFWLARDVADAEKRIAQRWPGWAVRWHRDQYEEQLGATRGLLSLPTRPRQTLVDQLQQMLLAEDMRSGADLVRELTERERKEGKKVEVNPWALRDDRLAISEVRRREILNAAVAALSW